MTLAEHDHCMGCPQLPQPAPSFPTSPRAHEPLPEMTSCSPALFSKARANRFCCARLVQHWRSSAFPVFSLIQPLVCLIPMVRLLPPTTIGRRRSRPKLSRLVLPLLVISNQPF